MKLTIIGAGPGGYVAALKAAQLGAHVTIIEDTEVGGTCLNRGCIPAKALIASSRALSMAKRLEEFGIDISGEVIPNISKIMERKDKVVSTLVKGIRSLFKSWGINLIEGRGMILTPKKVRVQKKDGSTEIIDCDKIIISTGSRPAKIPIFQFDGENILSSDDALTIKSIPKSMTIIGGGAIGCEFSTIFNEFGTEINIVEMMPRILPTEDPEISELLGRELNRKKIKIHKGITVEKVEVNKKGVHLLLSNGNELISEKVLVSVGRALNSEGIGLDEVGIKKGSRGEIIVNNKMETNVEGIYAVGDITGIWLLAYVASMQGLIAAYNACGIEKEIDYKVVPSAIFTSPEIGSVGLRENQAESEGIGIKKGYFHFRTLGKAHAMGEISGFVKVIVDSDTNRVIGVHIIGPHATDLIHEASLAIQAGLTAKDIAHMIHAHPTLSEALMEAAGDVAGEAIHKMKK